ncbi:MAG: glutaminyl-peptide cyclotransferase, partial [Pseudomonadota bacterium]
PAADAGEEAPAPTIPDLYTVEIVKTFPHDREAFTQGLFFAGGVLYESTGKVGKSALIRHDLFEAATAKTTPLRQDVFGEGATAVDGKIISLTWRDGVGFVHDLETMAHEQDFPIAGEGWGLTYDGTRLIMSDGTHRLRFLDPYTYEEKGSVEVKVGRRPLPRLNELEWIKGEVWANIWQQDVIARIDPKTGQVTGFIDLSGIYPQRNDPFDDVLNGIAYDPTTDRLLITGKRWSKMFEIRLIAQERE